MLSMREMPESERPRERLLAFGAENLSTYELLAIIIGSGSHGISAIEVAKALISGTNDLTDLKDKTVHELRQIRGMGEAKAIQVIAALELGKRVLNIHSNGLRIHTAADVFHLMKNDLVDLKQEVLYAIYLDLKTQIIAKRLVFVGGLNQSLIHPREVFKYAVKHSAYQIILVHNHPSGDPTPSEQDISVTKRFIEVGILMQIQVVDHVVIARNGFVSIVERLT